MRMHGWLWLCVSVVLMDSCRTHNLFTCEPVQVHWCHDMPYNKTFFPNILEHYDQDIAASKMKHFMPLVRLGCSPELHLFLCQAFIPECTDQTQVLQPCRERCQRVLSDCTPDMTTFDLTWPPELRCDRLKPCQPPTGGSPNQSQKVIPTPRISESSARDLGFWCPLQLKTRPGKGSSFLGAPDCAPPCANMYFKASEVRLAKTFIGVCSGACLCATLFTFLTFLINVKRFRYPERPIVFYAVSYSFVSAVYFAGFLLGDGVACERAAPAAAPTVVLGGRNKACTLVFVVLYFFSTAGIVWWVILTMTWFLAAGPKWSCEAIERKAVWYHAVAWGLPGSLTLTLLALDKVEGDGMGGVCFVGLYDLTALRWFVLAPQALGVSVGLAFLLGGIVSLNHVRQVIQDDERNQEKLKRFMIRIGVFSGLYLVPLLMLLACYVYEQALRDSWENTWINDHCQEYSIPCSSKKSAPARPDLFLFLMKYLMTLVMGISAVFWVSSKKTCSEWAHFFNRAHKDPISESRRVLQESCEFFLKHDRHVQHKKKHHKSTSHKLKVISKSMGTNTGSRTATPADPESLPPAADPGSKGTRSGSEMRRASDADLHDRAGARRSSSHGSKEPRSTKTRSSSRVSSSVVLESNTAERRTTPNRDLLGPPGDHFSSQSSVRSSALRPEDVDAGPGEAQSNAIAEVRSTS